MDVPVDLSRVLFVCTANTLDTIPAPLLDRMEVLEVSGYVAEEKMQIASRYLAPQAKEASGLADADVQLTEAAVDTLIKYYCRESGVRNLKKCIEKIYRKAALKLVQDLGEDKLPEPEEKKAEDAAATATSNSESAPEVATTSESTETQNKTTSTSSTDSSTQPPSIPVEDTIPNQEPPPNEPPSQIHEPKEVPVTTTARQPMRIPPTVHIEITPENLKEYVGPPVYQKDRMYARPPPPGVSTGLGYLGNGSGAVMPVEAMSMPGKGALQLTGKLGEVIRESAQIGLSWVRAHAFALGITPTPDAQFLTDRDVHVHMPEGSIGKEGPSAGTAILAAFVSLFRGVRVDPDIGAFLSILPFRP
ncbi:hypothetical protein CVT26_015029 [Gymnopilus dilepis]|uniref:Lon proteolytic domain-containing protein n=1 Tax=Gymnopilus dilepis TaxID=231916 RepID=A0A409X9X5_9AGAR|nr:hypothetical protein CVT26_015029 [Gymnopilus dilepis]